MRIDLESLDRCFHGIIPCAVATCSRDGTPNVSYVSQLQYVDANHVALSCQFFNKTRQNLDENPVASVEVYDPTSWEAYRLCLRFLRSETEGPLFDAMAMRIQAIASHTGMTGVFKLRSADVCEVISVEAVAGFLLPSAGEDLAAGLPVDGRLNELRGFQLVSDRINRSCDLDALLRNALEALDDVFRFRHSMVLVPADGGERLVTLASHGYGGGVGAEVKIGDGLIGAVAAQRKLLRIASVGSELRYGRAIRSRVHEVEGSGALSPEIPLPGLPDAESQLAIPLMARGQLIGVLALEARDCLTFAPWHEAFLQILANQIAFGIDRMYERSDDDAELSAQPQAPTPAPAGAPARSFCLYRNDDCVFVDGEYLIRNVPAKILWKLLRAHGERGQTEFSNRELRLDPSLGLPPFKDNLESRLILLRRRLEERCPDVRIVPVRRGRFALELDCTIELIERDSA